VVTRPTPRHPGALPATTDKAATQNHWQQVADTYAKYFLLLFRPEPLLYSWRIVAGSACPVAAENTPIAAPPLSYTWSTFQKFISDLQISTNMFDTFRLMMLHKRIVGLYTSFRTRAILTAYRSECADQWNPEQRAQYAEERRRRMEHLKNMNPHINVDVEHWNTENQFLSPRQWKLDQERLQWDKQQTESYLHPAKAATATRKHATQHHTNPRPSHQATLPNVPATVAQTHFHSLLEDAKTHPMPNPPADSNEQKTPSLHHLLPEHLVHSHLPHPSPSSRTLAMLFANYFLHPNSPSHQPPPVILATGAGGTGKTVATKAICAMAASLNLNTIRTSFNNLNALDIDGCTTSSLLGLRQDQKEPDIADSLTHQQLQHFVDMTQIQQPRQTVLIIVDEISNQSPIYLARLSKACQQATQNHDAYFGGIPVLLVGDFGQLGPVKQTPLCNALLTITQINSKKEPQPRPTKRQRCPMLPKRERTRIGRC
jgi:hypothetical protein